MTEFLTTLTTFFLKTARKATFAGLAAAVSIALPLMTDGVDKSDVGAAASAFVVAFLGTYGFKNIPKGK